MKKIFSIITAVITAAVCVLLITLSVVKQNCTFFMGEPYRIMVYNHGTTPLKSGGYAPEDKEFKEIDSKFKNIANLTLFDWLIHKNSLNILPGQDLESTFSTYSTDMKNSHVAIEYWFSGDNAQQDVVVKIGNDTKVISFDRIIFILPENNGFSNIVAYYSLNNSDWESQYKTCKPLVFEGRAGEMLEYVKSIKY